ncbi:MAG TPA: MFS transporter [Candidatus Dormibacteraeota bacterium]
MAASVDAVGNPSMVNGLWNRQINRYPDAAARYAYLGIVVAATITLYYQLYVNGAVAPSILHFFDISFNYYVLILVFGNALGAVASLVAGLADRWGRANLVAYGLFVTGALTLWALPNATSGFEYGVFYAIVSIVEGMLLVATPALIRDYSPQIGRASAMGFWTLGPVVGSLIVTEVASHTFTPPDWQHQYRICGVVALIVWAITFVGLRELSPKLRDQVMVSLRDRALIEAKARDLDVEQVLAHHWKSVARPNVIGSAFGVSLYLIIYYTAVAFAVIYLTTVFGFTQGRSNDLLNWWWGTEAVALVVVGLLSDRLLVRKPLMFVGGLGSVAMTLVLISVTGHSDTSFNTLAIVVAFIGFFSALSYAPWMAAFTETVEGLNPAAIATGLAIWGLIIRSVVSVSFLVIPHVISSVTPIVNHGAEVQAAVAQTPPRILQTVQAHQALFAQLAPYSTTNPPPAPLLAQAFQELGGPAQALATLTEVQKYKTQLAVLTAYGADVQAAQNNAASEWQRWFWICLGGQVVFIPLTFVLVGRWSPRKAREDEEKHERAVNAEMATMGLKGTEAPA